MRILFFVLAFTKIIYSDFCNSQAIEHQLSFTITDLKTLTPLENATISIQPCNCGGITDANGNFTISLPEDEYNITISFIGYNTYSTKISLTSDITEQIRLQEKEEQLSEIIIKARTLNENIDLPQMGVLRMKSEGLKKMPSAMGEFDVLRGVTLLAGVNNAGEISNGISVRGGSLDQNLILYDYAPVYNPTHVFGLFSVFTPDALSSVDLYRANIPSRYGGRVTSVMDVKVKNPYVDKFKMSGGIGLVSTRLSIESPLIKDKLMVMFNGRGGFTDFLLPIASKRLKDTEAKFGDGTIKLLYLPTDKDQITFTGFLSKDFYQLDLVTKVENVNAKNNQYGFGIFNGTVNWQHAINDDTVLKTILVGSNYTSKILFPEVDNDNKIEYESRIKYLSLISEINKKVNKKVDYYLGLQANRYKIHPGLLDPGTSTGVSPVKLETETSYELSGYANVNWSPSDFLTVSTGLRYTNFFFLGPYTLNTYDETGYNTIDTQLFEKGEKVQSYSGLEPRLGVVFKLSENTSIKASYARTNQYLQNIYNSTTPLPSSRWKTSDPHIKPQSGNTYSLGIYKNLNNNELELSLESYYRKAKNILTYKPGADFFLEEFLEKDVVQGTGESYGVEFSLSKPKGKVNGWINYTYSRSFLQSFNQNLTDRINNNKKYPSDFDRPHVFNSTINLEGNKSNTLSFNFTLQTGKPYTIANGIFELDNLDVPIFLERNNARLPVYHRLDFAWKIHHAKNKNKRWIGDWTFTVYNVYARRNPFNIYYSQRTGSEFNNIFSGSPLGSYEFSVLNNPLFSITYNFTFQ